jgi:hypothetical protein
MGLPVTEERVHDAEQELGREFPPMLRQRLLRENGGDIEVTGYPGDASWQLHPVWDPTDRRTATRSTAHVVHQTNELVPGSGVPDGAVVIAGNGSGDLLLLLAGDDDVHWWDHETHALHPVSLLLGQDCSG